VRVCGAPCDAELPVDTQYRVTGESIRPSAAFFLAPRGEGRVTLHVDASTTAAFDGGALVVTAGSIAVVGGIAALVIKWMHGAVRDISNAPMCLGGDGELSCYDPHDTEAAAAFAKAHPGSGPMKVATAEWAVVAAGAAVVGVGGWIMGANAQSSVKQADATEMVTALARLPTWHDDPIAKRVPPPSALPFLSGSF
jgi:hypothetical protein